MNTRFEDATMFSIPIYLNRCHLSVSLGFSENISDPIKIKT